MSKETFVDIGNGLIAFFWRNPGGPSRNYSGHYVGSIACIALGAVPSTNGFDNLVKANRLKKSWLIPNWALDPRLYPQTLVRDEAAYPKPVDSNHTEGR